MIDWTKPLEHIDGTPLKIDPKIRDNPDDAGDYYLIREDGQSFLDAPVQGAAPNLIVRPDGHEWLAHDSDPVLVRNRTPAIDWTQPLETVPDVRNPNPVPFEYLHPDGSCFAISRSQTWAVRLNQESS